MKNANTTELKRDRGALELELINAGAVIKGKKVLCPFHDDHTPSGSVYEKDGVWRYKCFACDVSGDIFDIRAKAQDVDVRAILKEANGNNGATKVKRERIAVHDYKDENGNIVYHVDRFNTGQKCLPRLPGATKYGIGQTKRVLYNLDRLINSNGQPVSICEGEKDCDILTEHDSLAVCCPFGAQKWKPEYNQYFTGRKVYLFADNDEPGEKHVEQVARSLWKIAGEIKIVSFRDKRQGYDVSDYISEHGFEKFRQYVKGNAEVYPGPTDEPEEPTTEAQTKFPLTDAGNGERFAAYHGEQVRYCYDWGQWLYFDGKRWKSKADAKVRLLAVETARAIQEEARKVLGLDDRDRLFKFGLASERSHNLNSMLTEARAQEIIESYARDFDKNPMKLNCLNGTIDLETGRLYPHERNDLITKLCPVIYDPDVKSDVWDSFLVDACKSGPDNFTDADYQYLQFLQRAIGYSITGDTSEEKLFLIHGPTAAGKSTFLEAVKSCLGDYSRTADFETFLHRNQTGGARNDIARLHSARFVVSIEVEEGKKLAEGLVKTVTGGDTIAARFLYQESFEFVPQFKLWLACNHAPRVSDRDDAVWRRILRLPFENSIPPDKQDTTIKKTLRNPKKAGPAILAWAVKGCLAWQSKGLDIPQRVQAATSTYRQDQDPLLDFFDECVFSPEVYVPVADLRAAYDQYAKDNGIKFTLPQRDFNERIQAKGCDRRSKWMNGKNTKCWCGIGLQYSPNQT